MRSKENGVWFLHEFQLSLANFSMNPRVSCKIDNEKFKLDSYIGFRVKSI